MKGPKICCTKFEITNTFFSQNKQRKERERRQQQAQASMQVLSKTQKSRERYRYYLHLRVICPECFFLIKLDFSLDKITSIGGLY